MLEIAEAGVYRVVWSEAILAELEDTLLYLFDQAGGDPQESRSAIHRLRRQMVTAFPDAIVAEWQPLEDAYVLPDPAIGGRACFTRSTSSPRSWTLRSFELHPGPNAPDPH